ncbi:MAG: HAD hydrolase-like protein [Candidatus Shapirobacteria bacterium]|nr:HAD hydrolase-like protein [Candidatus Shapirobacteria bacterium]
MKEKVLVVDLDNCLFLDEKTRKGSEEVKDEAWFDVFSECDRKKLELVLDKIETELAGGKGDRKDIVLKVCKFFDLPETEKDIEKRCKFFSEIVKKGILKIGVSNDNKKALDLISKKIPIYVNTATPKDQAKDILRDLDILKFFKDIYGRPETKMENMRLIVEREKIKSEECLYVDDQESGCLIAKKIGCNFIGMQTNRNSKWNNNIVSFPIIYSLLEIVK